MAARGVNIPCIVFLMGLLCACTPDPTPTTTPVVTMDSPVFPALENIPTRTPDSLRLGTLITAETLEPDTCTYDERRTFAEDTEIIYVIAEGSYVPAGMALYAKLYHNGAFELDSVIITADQTFEDTCLYFYFQYDTSDGYFRRGEYAAQIFGNGIQRDTAYFVVQ